MLRAQHRRAKVLRKTLSPPRRHKRRPDFEALERRQLLSTIDWTSKTSGSWDMASNWLITASGTHAVPGPNDDVIINVLGASPTVTIGSNVESVHSITADDPLVILGGGLTVAANSTISGGLSMTGGSLTASGSGISLTVTGTTTVSGASLFAEGGATLSLSEVTSYSGGFGYTDTLQATGTGSVLAMPELATIAEDTTNGDSWTQVQALAGASVELPALTQVGNGPVLLKSDGAGSQLNVSALTSFRGNVGYGHASTLQPSNGGMILDGSLTALTQVTVPLSSGTLSLPLVTDAEVPPFSSAAVPRSLSRP